MTPLHPIVWYLAGTIVLLEALFWAGDHGLIAAMRGIAYAHLAVGAVPFEAAMQGGEAAFWFAAGLVGHAFLHVGWMHVAFNTVGLLCLGHVVQAQAGTGPFLAVMAVTALAGAVLFLLITGGAGVMVGASGAVFGLLGVVLRWRAGHASVWRILIVLALLGLPAGLIFPGPIAWQAHLGGFLAGWVIGRLVPPRRLIRHPLM